MFDLKEITGFEWDRHNREKNWIKHKVNIRECEEVFINHPLVALNQKHSQHEIRYFALGKTQTERQLCISFTIRNKRIRIISARPMSRRERRSYEQEKA